MSTKCFTDHHHFTIIMKSRWNKYTDHIPDTVNQTRLILADGATSSHKSSQKLRDKKDRTMQIFSGTSQLEKIMIPFLCPLITFKKLKSNDSRKQSVFGKL
jgi:hypothetical protein